MSRILRMGKLFAAHCAAIGRPFLRTVAGTDAGSIPQIGIESTASWISARDGDLRAAVGGHGVTQVEAEEVFFNQPLLIGEDGKHSEKEGRYLALGKTNKARVLTVIFTLRRDGTLIRVISAREQHRKERKLYDQVHQ